MANRNTHLLLSFHSFRNRRHVVGDGCRNSQHSLGPSLPRWSVTDMKDPRYHGNTSQSAPAVWRSPHWRGWLSVPGSVYSICMWLETSSFGFPTSECELICALLRERGGGRGATHMPGYQDVHGRGGGGGGGVGGVLMYNSNSHADAETLPQLGCAPLISRI